MHVAPLPTPLCGVRAPYGVYLGLGEIERKCSGLLLDAGVSVAGAIFDEKTLLVDSPSSIPCPSTEHNILYFLAHESKRSYCAIV